MRSRHHAKALKQQNYSIRSLRALRLCESFLWKEDLSLGLLVGKSRVAIGEIDRSSVRESKGITQRRKARKEEGLGPTMFVSLRESILQ